MQEIMHVSQSEQQPQRPVLHLSDMLADVGSASPRAEEECQHAPRTVVLCLSLPSHVVNKVNEAAARRVAQESLRHVIFISFIRRVLLASGFLLKVDFRRFV